jgi:hypothetical protein
MAQIGGRPIPRRIVKIFSYHDLREFHPKLLFARWFGDREAEATPVAMEASTPDDPL